MKNKSLTLIKITLLIFLFFNHSASYSTGLLVEPYQILFDYDRSSHQDDALSVSDAGGTPITGAEWYYGDEISNPAYIKGQSNRKIKVLFDSQYYGIAHLMITVSYANGSSNGIGTICNLFVPNFDLGIGTADTLTIQFTENLPNYVRKHTYTWKWEIYAIPVGTTNYCAAWNTSYTTHSFYTLLAEPKAPMALPWTSVLDYACTWANGATTIEIATSKITEKLYYSGFTYETKSGAPNYGDVWEEFKLTDFISDIGSNEYVNCLDMAKAVVTFTNSVGANLTVTTWGHGGTFPLNCIDPIGLSAAPTNNTFRSELIGNDCRSGGFSYHAFAQNSNNHVWDACLKYDIDSNPDNVSNSNPDCGIIVSGYSWHLPCNESEVTYLSRLVDDWTKYHVYSTSKIKRNINVY